MIRALTLLSLLAATAALTGCGPAGAFDTVTLHGTVTCDGQPVTEGTLDFMPLPGAGSEMVGKPAAAKISADGTYNAGTYGESDGVVPGKKRVTYSAPLPEDSREAEQLKQSQYAGYQIEPSEIDVQADSGEINFVLVKPTKKK